MQNTSHKSLPKTPGYYSDSNVVFFEKPAHTENELSLELDHQVQDLRQDVAIRTVSRGTIPSMVVTGDEILPEAVSISAAVSKRAHFVGSNIMRLRAQHPQSQSGEQRAA